MLENTSKRFNLGLIHFITKKLKILKKIYNEKGIIAKKNKIFLNNVLNSTDDLIYYKNIDLEYIGCNGAFESFFNLKLENIIGKRDEDIFGEKILDVCKNCVSDLDIINNNSCLQKSAWIEINNESRFFSIKKAPLVNKKGEILGLVGVLRDITKDYNIKTRFQTITDGIGDGLYVTDEFGLITFINPSACEILGYSQSELIGKDAHDLIHYQSEGHKELTDECYIFSSIKSGKKYHSQNDIFIKKDGKLIDTSCISTPLIENEKIVGSITLFKDITDIKKAQELLVKSKMDEIELLKYHNRYHSLQQKNAFEKQFNMIRDDLSNLRFSNLYIETYFKPLDVLSGDSYGTFDLGDGNLLFYLVDSMGKGLSASVTSIQSTSFINHSIKKAQRQNNFSFERLINDYQNYIKTDLLDDELVAVIFLLFDNINKKFYLSNFSMPPILIHRKSSKKVDEIIANNPPIMRFFTGTKIDSYDIDDIKKILIYSDGIDENLTTSNVLYSNYLKNDFFYSKTKNDLCKRINSRITSIKDDMTFIFLKIISEVLIFQKTYISQNNLVKIDELQAQVEDYMVGLNIDEVVFNNVLLALHELLMNAYEHGNIGATYDLKQNLMKQDRYDDFLEIRNSITTDKIIKVTLSIYQGIQCKILKIDIEDEGDGFNASNFFKRLNLEKSNDIIRYSGRGVLMAMSLVDGVFFNKKGNIATMVQCLNFQESDEFIN